MVKAELFLIHQSSIIVLIILDEFLGIG